MKSYVSRFLDQVVPSLHYRMVQPLCRFRRDRRCPNYSTVTEYIGWGGVLERCHHLFDLRRKYAHIKSMGCTLLQLPTISLRSCIRLSRTEFIVWRDGWRELHAAHRQAAGGLASIQSDFKNFSKARLSSRGRLIASSLATAASPP